MPINLDELNSVANKKVKLYTPKFFSKILTGSGKTTLFKLLSNQLQYDGNILIFKKTISYNLKKGHLGLISPDLNYFKGKLVVDELIDILKFKDTEPESIKTKIETIAKKTGIINILNNKISTLNIKEKILVMIAIQLLSKPEVLIIDNAFSFLDNEKENIKTELKRICKKSTIINITNDTDECLWGDEVLFLKDNPTTKKTNKLDSEDFISNDLSVPFIISLSEKLKFYGLIEKSYLYMERLVDDLWQ